MPDNGHLDITQVTSVVNNFTTKADERFLNVNDMSPSSANDINNLKKSIWPNTNITINDFDSSSIIPFKDFEYLLNSEQFDNRIVGARVTDTNGHNWRIIQNNGTSYDLWYEESIGNSVFSSNSNNASYAQWANSQLRTNLNSSLFYNNTAKLPTAMKNRIVAKTVNAGVINGTANSSNCNVWILTATELGLNRDYSLGLTSDGTLYSYFSSSSLRGSSAVSGSWSYYRTASCIWNSYYARARAYSVRTYGDFDSNGLNDSIGVVPAIRVA